MSLASQDLIVIAAVINKASLRTFDQQLLPSNRGFVAVRHLDLSSLSDSMATFASDVRSTLALRFPLTAAGDPFARPGDNATLIGVVNALSYIQPLAVPDSVRSAGTDGLSQAMHQHVIGPLGAISALLPELRIAPKRMYSANPECSAPVTIITLICHAGGNATATQRLLSDAAKTGADALREELVALVSNQPQQSQQQQRPLRMTVLDITAPSQAPLPIQAARPTAHRSVSNNWQIRDRHTVQLQEKVADLILASNVRSVLRRRYRVRTTPLVPLPMSTAQLQAGLRVWLDKFLRLGPVARVAAWWRGPTSATRRTSGSGSSGSQSQQQLVRSNQPTSSRPDASQSSIRNAPPAPATSAAAGTTSRGTGPYSHSSGTPSQLELGTPSGLDTGSSGGESSNDEAYILRSAPSSADGEDDNRWRQGSPWLGPQGTLSSSRASSSAATEHPAASDDLSQSQTSGQDSPALGASWVRLGDSQQR